MCVSLVESLCGSLYSVTYVGDNGTKSCLAIPQGLCLLYFNLERGRGGGAERGRERMKWARERSQRSCSLILVGERA